MLQAPLPQHTNLQKKLPAPEFGTDYEYDSLQDAFKNGKAWLQFRLRHERVNTGAPKLRNAYGTTLRSRLGFTSGYYHHISGTAEFSNNTVIGKQKFNGGGGTSPSLSNYAIIADPNVTEVLQAFGTFNAIPNTKVQIGRQLINLDDQRFVGTVGFRQTEQSYDSGAIDTHFLPDTDIYYAYVWQVNRIWGPKADPPKTLSVSKER